MTPTTPGTGPTEPPPLGGDGVADPVGHPTVESVSDLIEDLLDPEAAEAVRLHLDDCLECTEILDALQEIRSLLGNDEVPPMPADVADRIDAALAAEALLASTAPRPGEEQGPAASASASSTDRTPDVALVTDRAAPHSDRTRPRSGTRPAGGPGRGTRRRRTARALMAGAAVLAAVGLGGTLLHGLPTGTNSSSMADNGSAAGGPHASAAAGAQPFSGARRQDARSGTDGGSGTAYTRENLSPQIMQLVSDRIRPTSAAKATGSAKPIAPRTGAAGGPAEASAPSLPGCVLEATGRVDDEPVATDLGTFEGGPVGVLVYPDGQADDDFEVFIIDSTCDATAPGAVRLHRTVPRP